MPTPHNPDQSGAPPPFDSEATKFSAANAFRLSLLANAAYLNQPDAERVANNLGLPQFEWIDLTEQFRDLYGFAAGCDDYAVLAFRGTANLKDWMTNLNAAPARFHGFSKVPGKSVKCIRASHWPCGIPGRRLQMR